MAFLALLLGNWRAVLAAVVAGFLAYHAGISIGEGRGSAAADARCQAAALQAERDAARIDLEAARESERRAHSARMEEKRRADANEQTTKEYEHELRTRPAPGCALGPADLKRLQPSRRPGKASAR